MNRTLGMGSLPHGISLFANAEVSMFGTAPWLIVVVSLCAGLLESVLLQRWYEVRPVLVKWTGTDTLAAVGMSDEPDEWSLKSTFLVLASNLVSAFVGLLFISHDNAFRQWILGARPLEHIGLYFTSLWLISFVVSAAIEWPFFSVAIKDRPASREGLAVCLGCNIVSSACILVCVSLMGMTAAVAGTQTANASTLAQDPVGHVYFVDHVTGRICAIDSDGSNLHATKLSTKPNGGISAENVGADTKIVTAGKGRVSLFDFGPKIQAAKIDDTTGDAWTRDARYFDESDRRLFDVHYGPLPSDGLSVVKPDGIYKIAVDSALVSWHWSHVTVMPNGQAIGQLGPQIVLIDLQTGATAVLGRGESPTVVLNQ